MALFSRMFVLPAEWTRQTLSHDYKFAPAKAPEPNETEDVVRPRGLRISKSHLTPQPGRGGPKDTNPVPFNIYRSVAPGNARKIVRAGKLK